MTLAKLDRTIRGVGELKLLRIADNAVLDLPTPTGFTIENGIEQKILTTQNGQGEMTRASSYIKGRMPLLQIVYNFMQPEILQFKIGNSFEPQTRTVSTAKTFVVLQNDYPAITDATKIGYNVVADQPTVASLNRNNFSVQLTQQPFATFDATVNDSFAIGVHFEVKFSNNLVANLEAISMITQESFNGYGISDNIVGAFKIKASIVTTLNEVIIFEANNCTPSYDGANINTDDDNIQIPFFINDVPGSCFPYQWFYTNKFITC